MHEMSEDYCVYLHLSLWLDVKRPQCPDQEVLTLAAAAAAAAGAAAETPNKADFRLLYINRTPQRARN